jgi:hypothetical protein
MISRQPIDGTELREMLPSMLLFTTENQDRASTTRFDVVTFVSTQLKVGRECYEFHCGIA